ncbi:MAG TPA: serine hydrolase [Thermomicrobiales bacterium]|nr:serine hydrolase [Thermomicrobiales bacterium]
MPHLNRRNLVGAALAAAIVPIASAGQSQQPGPTVWPVPDWPRTNSAEMNVDPALPELLANAGAATPSVTGVVVTRAGRIVADYWADGWGPDDPIDIRSCTKSVVGALVGRARHDGLLPDLTVTIGELIPERIPEGADPAVANITLWSLLTMTSGLAWTWQDDYPRLEAAADPVALTLGLPIAAPQGTAYVYNSGDSHIIGLMVAAAARMPLEEYAEEALFAPLGITMHGWRRTPQGEVIGGYGLQIVPEDMARLGYLYLRDGAWNGEQLIAPEYIEQSIIVQSSGDPTGGTPYGYQWWVTTTWTGYDAFYALGYGGQYIWVVPALELVIAIAVGDISVPLYPPRPIIEQTIIPLMY